MSLTLSRQRRFQFDSSVSLHIAAVSSSTRQNVPLYLHRESLQNPLKLSVACSLMCQKTNVDVNSSIPVSRIDIIEVLTEIDDSPLRKVDIECGELEVTQRLVENASSWPARGLLLERHDFLDSISLDKAIDGLREAKGPGFLIVENWP